MIPTVDTRGRRGAAVAESRACARLCTAKRPAAADLTSHSGRRAAGSLEGTAPVSTSAKPEDEQSHSRLRINGVSSHCTAVTVFWVGKHAQ